MPHPIGHHDDPLDTLRFSGETRRATMRKLKDRERSEASAGDRRSARRPAPDRLVCTFSYADKIDREVWFKAELRDISEHGVGLLHGSFIYLGSPAILRLTLPDGETIAVHGTVRRCQFISGRVHDIGIEFEEPLDLPALLGQDTPRDEAA